VLHGLLNRHPDLRAAAVVTPPAADTCPVRHPPQASPLSNGSCYDCIQSCYVCATGPRGSGACRLELLARVVAKQGSMANRTQRPKLNPIRSLSEGLNYFALFLPGGLENVIDLARFSENENVQEVARRWNALPRRERKNASLDDLCKAAGVGASKFLGVVVATAHELGMDVSGVVAAIANLETMPAHMERVAKRGGFRDRERVLQSVGFYPSNDRPGADQPAFECEGLQSFEEETIEFTRLVEGW